jgi:hypothetical protein
MNQEKIFATDPIVADHLIDDEDVVDYSKMITFARCPGCNRFVPFRDADKSVVCSECDIEVAFPEEPKKDKVAYLNPGDFKFSCPRCGRARNFTLLETIEQVVEDGFVNQDCKEFHSYPEHQDLHCNDCGHMADLAEWEVKHLQIFTPNHRYPNGYPEPEGDTDVQQHESDAGGPQESASDAPPKEASSGEDQNQP